VNDEDKFFTSKDIARILSDLDYPAGKPEIEKMIWEIDENVIFILF
jgi:hypothetical protein